MVCEKSLRRRRDHHARGGLILLEPVVVMAILIALAGILVPVFPDLLARASTSTGATNLTEVAKAVQMYQGLYRSYPDLLDSLVDGTGALLTTANAGGYIPDSTTATLQAAAPTNDYQVLNAAGLANLCPMSTQANSTATAWAPTFWPYATDLPFTALPINATNKIAYLSPAVAASKFGIVGVAGTTLTCAVFGLVAFPTRPVP